MVVAGIVSCKVAAGGVLDADAFQIVAAGNVLAQVVASRIPEKYADPVVAGVVCRDDIA
jgi:hypothetical protein